MSWIAIKQTATNQNYSLFCDQCPQLTGDEEFCPRESIHSDLAFELLIVSTYRHQLWVATTYSGWSVSNIRSKCLYDLDLELHTTWKVGCILCTFMLFLLSSSRVVWRVDGLKIFWAWTCRKTNCWAVGELLQQTSVLADTEERLRAFPWEWLRLFRSTASTDRYAKLFLQKLGKRKDETKTQNTLCLEVCLGGSPKPVTFRPWRWWLSLRDRWFGPKCGEGVGMGRWGWCKIPVFLKFCLRVGQESNFNLRFFLNKLLPFWNKRERNPGFEQSQRWGCLGSDTAFAACACTWIEGSESLGSCFEPAFFIPGAGNFWECFGSGIPFSTPVWLKSNT